MAIHTKLDKQLRHRQQKEFGTNLTLLQLLDTSSVWQPRTAWFNTCVSKHNFMEVTDDFMEVADDQTYFSIYCST